MLQAPVNSYLENRSRHRGKEGELLKIPNLINKIIFIAQKKIQNMNTKRHTLTLYFVSRHILRARNTSDKRGGVKKCWRLMHVLRYCITVYNAIHLYWAKLVWSFSPLLNDNIFACVLLLTFLQFQAAF